MLTNDFLLLVEYSFFVDEDDNRINTPQGFFLYFNRFVLIMESYHVVLKNNNKPSRLYLTYSYVGSVQHC